MSMARNYRETVVNYFIQKKIFSSFAYFTPQPEDQFFSTWEDLLTYVTGGACKSWDEVNEWGKMHGGSASILYKVDFPKGKFEYYSSLDLSDFPTFDYHESGFSHSIHIVFMETGMLLIIFIILFWMLYKACIRYDVR